MEKKMLISGILIITYLFYVSVIDIKKKELSRIELLIGIIPAILGLIFNDSITLMDAILGALFGILVLIVAIVSKGQIGVADGIILVQIGFGFGVVLNLVIFGLALMLVAFFSVILLIIHRLHRKSRIPFIPFLLLGTIVVFTISLL